MKSIMLTVLMVFTFVCFGESYLVIDSQSKEVISLSVRDDAMLEAGWEKIILPDSATDYTSQMQHHVTFYKYKNNRFVENVQKLNDEQLAIEEAEELAEELALVEARYITIAMEELEAEGKVFKHLKKDKP